ARNGIRKRDRSGRFARMSVGLDRLAVVAAAEFLVGLMVDPLIEEPYRPVDEYEIHATRVLGFEADRHGPVGQVMRGVVAATRAGVKLIVERDDGGTTRVAEVTGPSPVSRRHVLVLG